MNTVNNLFPPIINTYMPSFIKNKSNINGGKCRVYFSLSDFNNYSQVCKNIQVTVNDKNTNQSVLNPDLYPAGIKIISQLGEDNTIKTKMKYFIDIMPEDLKDGEFKTNRFYKVQIRFTDSSVPLFNPDAGDKIASWLVNNQKYFSEWSSVCLIRGIEMPVVTIRGFESNLQNKEVIFTSESVQLTGNIQFINPNGENYEYVENINATLYKTHEGPLINKKYNIPLQQNLTASKSEFNYVIKDILEEGVSYTLDFTYITNGGYQSNIQYIFKIIQYGIDKINAEVIAIPDDAEGRIKIDIKALEDIKEEFMGKITIRRASSESNFTEWEDVHHIVITEAKRLAYTWYDYTIKSGVWYRYCIQRRNRRNDRGIVVKTKEPVMALFEDSFLTQGGRQLKLKFDMSIGSFKYNILESKTDTLGSQYPFIRRNGKVKYRQFPINGLITSFCDEAGLFTTKQDIYGDNILLYETYNKNNDISEYKDFSYEREFRERVMDFLYEDNIKLFKSPTEGNILIKLMDINLTPNQTLGRMLYSFSATAYEMDDANITNFNSFNIQNIGELTGDIITKVEKKLGKVIVQRRNSDGTFTIKDALTNNTLKISCPENNIVSLINGLNLNSSAIGFDNHIEKIKQIKLVFTSQPQLIQESEGVISIMDRSSQIKENDIITVGYYIKINGQDIVIKANPQYSKQIKKYSSGNGFIEPIRFEYATFELNDLDIYSLELMGNPLTEITYVAENLQQESLTKLVDMVYYYKKIGQLNGQFRPGHSITKDLYLRYTDKYKEPKGNGQYKEGYEELIAINGLSIEAPQGTLLLVKDSLDTHFNQHEVSDIGYLNLENSSSTINECYIQGIRLIKGPYQENYPELTQDRDDFVNKYPYASDNIYDHIDDMNYINQYQDYRFINGKISIGKKYIDDFPEEPIKNGVYMKQLEIGIDENNNPIYEYEFWIYYKDNWYPFDYINDVVQCPVNALINYYCETVEGEYEE